MLQSKIVSHYSTNVGQLWFGCNPATVIDSWATQNEGHRWTLDGYTIQEPIRHAFYEDVRSDVYGMNYEDWKKKFQKPIDNK